MRPQPVISFFILISCLLSLPASAQWVQASGPYDSSIPEKMWCQDNMVFAQVGGALWMSSDNSVTWQQMGPGKVVNSLVSSRDGPGTLNIFAGIFAWDGGVYRTTNFGASWTHLDSGLTNRYIWSLAVVEETIFAGTFEGVFRSTDNGDSWTKTNLPGEASTALGVLGNDLYVLLRGSRGPVCVTNDGGSTWKYADTVLSGFNHMSQDGATFYVSTPRGIFRSVDDGSTWTAINDGLGAIAEGGGVSQVIVHKNLPDMLIAIIGPIIISQNSEAWWLSDGGIYASTNDGDFWTMVDTSGLTVPQIITAVATDSNLFVVTALFGCGRGGCSIDAGQFLRHSLSQLIIDEVESSAKRLPIHHALFQNYPNPFNPGTTIQYQLPTASRVSLRIYNVLGAVVSELADEVQDAGFKQVEWDASSFASGIYFYRMEATSVTDPSRTFTSVKKMVLMK